MGMGGGGGAAQSPTDRAKAAYAAGIKDPKELQAIGQGMTPMSYENYQEGKSLLKNSFPDVQKYGGIMANLGSGGLMVRGLNQLVEAQKDTSGLAAGITNRTASRYGLDPNSASAQDNLDTSVSDVGAQIGADNQARAGLVGAMQALRLQGIQV